MAAERLQKILAQAGFGSRRACEEFILAGRVEVDGQVVRKLGTRADLATQEVKFDGQAIRQQKLVHYLLYKPSGVVCSLAREGGKARAVDLIRDERRLYTVGRLDEESEGLIIVTNDGELTERLTHPRFGVPKEYAAEVDGPVAFEAVKKLRGGVYLAEGRTSPARVAIRRQGRRAVLGIEIREGLNRQVRRMLAAVGLKVRRLLRLRIGPVTIGDLAPGRYRPLSSTEVQALLAAASPEARKRPHPPRRRRPSNSRLEGSGEPR
jgi:23S rRNA pseudouridine2605 synthase